MSKLGRFASVVILLFFCTYTGTARAESLGPNLISNASFENATAGSPDSWKKGGYGSNTRTLTYPATPAEQGSSAAHVDITSYTSGDAKWYFNPISIEAGATYQFSDFYLSNASTEVDAQITKSDGSVIYLVLGKPSAAGAYAQFTARFTAPAGSASLTIFHVIAQQGSLTVDNYTLQKVLPDTNNLIPNGSFESSSSGSPTNWNRGGWGNNVRSFTYPVAGQSGNAAQVDVTSYSSGDAKWYFDPVALPEGIYTYADSYKSNVPSMLVVQFHNADGSYTYSNLDSINPSGNFTSASAGFVVPSGTLDVTVFHLISSVGFLTIDNASLVKNTFSGGIFSTGAVTFTFDNGWLSQYQNAYPKLKSLRMLGTFYIITHELSDFGFTGFVSKAQIKEMYANGMEIGSHTQTHPHLPQLSSAAQQQEIQGSKQDLLALSVGPVDSFAYPFGEYDTTSTALVEQYYTHARSTQTGYTIPTSDIWHLPRLVVLNSTSVSEVENWIDEAARTKVWLIIEFHQVDTSGDTYAITPSNFNQVIDYASQKKIPVISMHQGVQYIQ